MGLQKGGKEMNGKSLDETVISEEDKIVHRDSLGAARGIMYTSLVYIVLVGIYFLYRWLL